ncbi:hypothetical protein [Flaviflagellibacter deserti]|uniref:Uncharacterized protein n=1 Tax=Flaviflagellibacter deserti TaxID=2267266 RepID=A0ABV9YYU9_9HYPH
MVGYWTLGQALLALGWLYSFISIIRPLPPIRSRWLALALFGVLAFGFEPISNQISKAEQAVHVAEVAARERLQSEEPERYAALMRQNEEQVRTKEAERQARVAAKLEQEAQETALAPQRQQDQFVDALKSVATNIIQDISFIDQEDGQLKGKLVRVTYFQPEFWSEAGMLFSASEAYKRVAQLTLKQETAYSGVQFIVKALAVDDYKRTEEVYAFVFSLPRKELMKIQWDEFLGADMLNLSTVDTKSLGRGIARSYCEDYRTDAARFCRAVVR